MSKKTLFFLFSLAFGLSVSIALMFGGRDKISLCIACLGSFGTLATLYVAYVIFFTYSSPVDIQKKRFELVDKALAFFITKRSMAILDDGGTCFLYFTKQRLALFEGYLKISKRGDTLVVISNELFEFLLDFQGQLEHHYFPYQLKKTLLCNLPQMSAQIAKVDTSNKVKFTVQYDSNEYGYPDINGYTNISITQFITHIHTIRSAMIEYLNDRVPFKYRIIDDNI
jgi:hypothetical protein